MGGGDWWRESVEEEFTESREQRLAFFLEDYSVFCPLKLIKKLLLGVENVDRKEHRERGNMGNGWTEGSAFSGIPEDLLLKIFHYLDFASLARISGVSRDWCRVSRDELVWKRRFLWDYKLGRNQALRRAEAEEEEVSWLAEYERLVWRTPVRLCQSLKRHKDEILHLSFSPQGTLIATCSKDSTVKVWSCPMVDERTQGGEGAWRVELLMERDLGDLFAWRYTQFSSFNDDGSLLLVSGVHSGEHNTQGEIAIFEVDLKKPGLRFRCRVLNRPYDVFGCWYDANHVLSGELYWLGSLSSSSHFWLCKASQETHTERTAVIAPLFKNASNIRMIVVSTHVSVNVKTSIILAQRLKERWKQSEAGRGRRKIAQEDDPHAPPLHAKTPGALKILEELHSRADDEEFREIRAEVESSSRKET